MPSALLMIDFINDIVHPDGKIANCAPIIKQNDVIRKSNLLLEKMRHNKVLVIWVVIGFSAHYLELNDNSPIFKNAKAKNAFIIGSWGTQIIDDINYYKNEIIIIKNRINPFHKTNLELILHTNEIDKIYLAGVSTPWAIESACRDAHDRDYKVNVIEDICASYSNESHETSINTMRRIANIVNSNEI